MASKLQREKFYIKLLGSIFVISLLVSSVATKHAISAGSTAQLAETSDKKISKDEDDSDDDEGC